MMFSMAIKINVIEQDQDALNLILESAGYRRQRRKFHCTIGFLENMIPPGEAFSFGQSITDELQYIINRASFLYEVEKATHLFNKVLVFEPTAQTQDDLKRLHLWLVQRVYELSEGRWGVSQEPSFENFTPHLTLWHTASPDYRFKKLEAAAATHPAYHLGEAAYVIFS